jgi:GNAT superfamily N-acetyltransferase
VIAPEHRGRGVFARIMEHALADLRREGVTWLFNFSASAATRLGSLAMQWRAAGPIERMARRPGAPVEPRQLLGWLRGATRRFGRRGGLVVSETPRPAAMAELNERIGRDARIRHVRDTGYFAWRFQNPLSSYRFIYFGARRVHAYVVLRRARHPGARRATWIADWAGESAEARLRVLAAALEQRARLELWSGALPDADRMGLRQAGFRERPVRSFAEYYPCVLVRTVAPEPPPPPWRLEGLDLLDVASWDVRLLDSDGA